MPPQGKASKNAAFDGELRQYIYNHTVRRGRVPVVKEMARSLARPLGEVRSALNRLSQSHAFMLQENGELWRAAPFSAIPTAFPVEVGKRTWFGNCVWDALGILAMLHRDGRVLASCGCCNDEMPLRVQKGSLEQKEGIIHFAVPARQWYEDVVFT